jgi:hypothetical protein
MLHKFLQPLRKDHPAIYWALILFGIVAWNVVWILASQPTLGRQLAPWEIIYLVVGILLFVDVVFLGWSSEVARETGAKLTKSRWTGLLLTLTTIMAISFGAEWFLRLFYITTDAYGFTAMNYWWYQNYGLAQDNSLGYRDREPLPDSPGLIRIAIVGDSFAMGHGVNNRDDTFAQIIEDRLGDSFDVNLIADSGRDTDLHLPFLEQYPFTPNILVYSYYLNDIDYLLEGDASPDANFAFIENEQVKWFVTEFFLPNYLYYNLLQFTNQGRNAGFVNSLLAGYDDPAMWDEQRFRLNQMIDWAEARDIPFIVLMWPHIASIEASQPVVAQVSEVFTARGVEVVDMSPILAQHPVNQLVVNRFDTHPSAFAHQLAADALEPIIRQDIERVQAARGSP